MAAIDNYDLAQDANFRSKVKSLMLKSAIAVCGEDPTNKSTAFIQKRANAANFTIYNQGKAMDIFSHLVTANGTLTIDSSDNDIEFTINSLWDDYSNVTYNEAQPI